MGSVLWVLTEKYVDATADDLAATAVEGVTGQQKCLKQVKRAKTDVVSLSGCRFSQQNSAFSQDEQSLLESPVRGQSLMADLCV